MRFLFLPVEQKLAINIMRDDKTFSRISISRFTPVVAWLDLVLVTPHNFLWQATNLTLKLAFYCQNYHLFEPQAGGVGNI